jgi:hypothetical protein
MMSSCLSLLFFFLSVSEPINPNPVISPPHICWRPLLLRVRLHCAPSSVSSVCASTPAPHSSSTSKRPGTVLSTRPSPPALPRNRVVRPTFTTAPGNRRWDHAPPPSGPRLPELFHLQQFRKPSPSLFPFPSMIMLRSLLIIRLLGLVICLEVYKSLVC